MNILVVEDDFVTLHVMEEIISEYGTVTLAEDGAKAVQIFNNTLEKNERFDIVFLDIMLPEMDGHGVLKTIRSIERQHNILGLDASNVIMTTALGDFQNVRGAFKEQCEGYLVKPVSKDKVHKILLDLELITS